MWPCDFECRLNYRDAAVDECDSSRGIRPPAAVDGRNVGGGPKKVERERFRPLSFDCGLWLVCARSRVFTLKVRTRLDTWKMQSYDLLFAHDLITYVFKSKKREFFETKYVNVIKIKNIWHVWTTNCARIHGAVNYCWSTLRKIAVITIYFWFDGRHGRLRIRMRTENRKYSTVQCLSGTRLL